jgi:hypothetical protein
LCSERRQERSSEEIGVGTVGEGCVGSSLIQKMKSLLVRRILREGAFQKGISRVFVGKWRWGSMLQVRMVGVPWIC